MHNIAVSTPNYETILVLKLRDSCLETVESGIFSIIAGIFTGFVGSFVEAAVKAQFVGVKRWQTLTALQLRVTIDKSNSCLTN